LLFVCDIEHSVVASNSRPAAAFPVRMKSLWSESFLVDRMKFTKTLIDTLSRKKLAIFCFFLFVFFNNSVRHQLILIRLARNILKIHYANAYTFVHLALKL